jgi:cytochrome c oxidase subunit IV
MESHHQIIPLRIYVVTYLSLVVLALANVVVAQFDLGPMNMVLMFGIVFVMATIDLLFFMGFRWDRSFNFVFFLAGFAFLGVFWTFTMADIAFRNLTNSTDVVPTDIKSPVKLLPEGAAKSPHENHQ